MLNRQIFSKAARDLGLEEHFIYAKEQVKCLDHKFHR
jgi:hypothetical protein